MITQRAAIIGMVGGCFYLITIVNSLPSYFYVLTWLAASALVACFGLALLALQGLNCRWRVERKSAAEDLNGLTGPVLQIELSNVGTLNKTGFLLEVRMADAQGIEVRRSFLIEALPARAQLASEITLTELTRGRYDIREVRIIGSDVLGLFRASKSVRLPRDMAEDTSVAARSEVLSTARRARSKVEAKLAAREWGRNTSGESPRVAQLLVGPATVNLGRTSPGFSREAAGGESTASDLTGRGDEMRGTRPYVAGDDLRSVHWKSTARLGQLVVREFDRTTRAESVVIWDGGVSFQKRAGNVNLAHRPVKLSRGKKRVAEFNVAVEQGLRLVASLCRAISESGKPCALLRLDSDPMFIAAPKRGAASLAGQFGDALAVADFSRESDLPSAIAVFLRFVPPGADVFLVTALVGEELRRAVHALQRLGTAVIVVRVDNGEAGTPVSEVPTVVLDARSLPEDQLAPVRSALLATLDPRTHSIRGEATKSGSTASDTSTSAKHGAPVAKVSAS
jgi:uncharacterized protein (DUF58 family)